MNFLTGDDVPEPVLPVGMWTDDDLKRFMALVNARMQGGYAAALGHTTRAYDISDKLAVSYAYAVEEALKEMGLRPKDD